MIDRLLNNWKAKLASLLVAVAVWYLFKENIRRQDQGPIISDPGVLSASVWTSPGCPAAGGMSAMATLPAHASVAAPPSIASMADETPQRELFRLRWIELGPFSAGIAVFPAYRCG